MLKSSNKKQNEVKVTWKSRVKLSAYTADKKRVHYPGLPRVSAQKFHVHYHHQHHHHHRHQERSVLSAIIIVEFWRTDGLYQTMDQLWYYYIGSKTVYNIHYIQSDLYIFGHWQILFCFFIYIWLMDECGLFLHYFFNQLSR